MALFLAVTLAPAIALGWLGWSVLEQDRELERQRQADRLALAADRVVAELGKAKIGLEEAFAAWLATPPAFLASDGAIVAAVGPGGVSRHVGAPLVFVSGSGIAVEPSLTALATAERFEHRDGDLPAARTAYRALASSSDRHVRASALVGQARVERKAGQLTEAAHTYLALRSIDATVAGAPAALVAGLARCNLLHALGRPDERDREAGRIREALEAGAWRLDRSTYLLATHQAARAASGCDVSGDVEALTKEFTSLAEQESVALADGVDRATRAAAGDVAQFAGGGQPPAWTWIDEAFVVSGATNGSDRVVLVASPRFLLSRWRHIWTDQQVDIAFLDRDGGPLLGSAQGAGVTRQPVESGLPWTLRIVPAATAAGPTALDARRPLLLAGLALLTFVILAGTYVVGRAIRRELAFGRLQREFVAAVSHEFRTPLTSIGHLVENLRSGRAISEERRQQYYDVLAAEAGRLGQFVEATLDFSRMEAGAAEYRFSEVDLLPLVSQVVSDFQHHMATNPRDVHLDRDRPSPTVRADPDAVALAIRNLLDNAAKYSPPGEPIDVDVERERDAVAVRVRDRGPGIPRQEQSEIFEKFARGESARRAGIRGTGLGLALVSHIARAHGGRVGLESQPGRGSTFTIWLPATGPEAS
jgi:signal transduction histidine kinase